MSCSSLDMKTFAASEATPPMFDNILRPTVIAGQIARVGAEGVA